MDFFGIAGILVIAIPFIVNILKNKVEWIGTRYAPVAAFVLGIVGGLIGWKLGFTPEGMTLIQCIVSGVAIGGTSTGLYDVAKKSIAGN